MPELFIHGGVSVMAPKYVPEPSFHDTFARIDLPWYRIVMGSEEPDFWDRREPTGTLHWWDLQHWAIMQPLMQPDTADRQLLSGNQLSVWELAAAAWNCTPDIGNTDAVLAAVSKLEHPRDRELIMERHWSADIMTSRQLMATWRLCPGWNLRSQILAFSDAPRRMLVSIANAEDDTDHSAHLGVTPIRTIREMVIETLVGRVA